MPNPNRQPTPPAAYAAIAALALCVVITWPLVLLPKDLLLGHPGNDNWNHVWGYWWVAESVSAGVWPQWTNLLSFPDGGTLYFIDTVQALMATPIHMLVGPAMAYNLIVMFGFALSAAWLLVYRVGDPICDCDYLRGVPHLLGQAYNGISETVCAVAAHCAVVLAEFSRSDWRRAVGLERHGHHHDHQLVLRVVCGDRHRGGCGWKALRQPWIQPGCAAWSG